MNLCISFSCVATILYGSAVNAGPTLEYFQVVCYDHLEDIEEVVGDFVVTPLSEPNVNNYQPLYISGDKAEALVIVKIGEDKTSFCGIWKADRAKT